MTITCPQCQHKNPDDTEFCENCGAQLPVASPVGVTGSSQTIGAVTATAAPTAAPDGLLCPTCKAPYAVGDVFCFNCGTDLSKLPANQPAGASAAATNGNGQSAPPQAQTTATAPATATTPAANANDMSPDDWDKAFAAPTISAATSTATAPATSSASTLPPATAPDDDSHNAFAAPISTPAPDTDTDTATGTGNGGGNAFSAPTAAVPSVATATSSPAKPGTLRLHVVGPYGDEALEYKGTELLLGRQDAKTRVFPDVNLDDGAASRRHLSIWQEASDGLFYAQDLESSNGTSLNGRDMESGVATQINNGDVIKIGTRYSIQVRIS